MHRKLTLLASCACLYVCAALPLPAHAEPADQIRVFGLVRQPLSLSMNDLEKFQTVQARQNEVTMDKKYHGAFNYRGIPLKSLLELCHVEKEESDFTKLIDLAVIVKNRDGKRVVLSWGEVAYRNAGDVIIATGGAPVMPMVNCTLCHKSSDEYRRWQAPLERTVRYPKLVMGNDFYAERCLENIESIEIADMGVTRPVVRSNDAYSADISVTGKDGGVTAMRGIEKLARISQAAKQAGDGKGFHGLKEYGGVSLADALAACDAKIDIHSALILSAPDGYRSLISGGELLLSPAGRRIMIADTLDGKPISKLGKYHIVLPDDLSADRWVKAVDKIEIVPVREKPRLSIVGVGCGDTRLITLEAISAMADADAFVCSDDISQRFAKYIGGKPRLYDPLLSIPHYYQKKNPGVSAEEAKKRVAKIRKENIRQIQDTLKAGRSIAFLEYGDPAIFGSWTYWLYRHFTRDDIRVVPGISAFNAANAMIGKNVAINGSVVITVPDGIRSSEGMVEAVAKNGDTLAIFVGLRELKGLMPLFEKYYAKDTPVVVIYKAGYSNGGRMITTNLRDVIGIVEKDKEQYLGLIYIGEALK